MPRKARIDALVGAFSWLSSPNHRWAF